MAVHCVPVSDDELLDHVEAGTRLLIVGCPICASICSALGEDRPIWNIDYRGINANAIRSEVQRLAAIFTRRGVKVSTYVRRIPLSLCLADSWGQSIIRRKAQSCDKILVLSCEVGQKTMASLLGGRRIIGGMTAKGLLRLKIRISLLGLRICAVNGSGETWMPDETTCGDGCAEKPTIMSRGRPIDETALPFDGTVSRDSGEGTTPEEADR